MSVEEYTTSELLKAVAARRKREPKKCPMCPTVFNGWARQVYCSRRCADKAFYEANKTRRNAARTLARRAKTAGQGDEP